MCNLHQECLGVVNFTTFLSASQTIDVIGHVFRFLILYCLLVGRTNLSKRMKLPITISK
jgi:hypothetical protein